MNFSAASLPPELCWLGWLLAAVVLAHGARQVVWRDLLADGLFHRWAAAVVVLALLWSLRGHVRPGFDLHLLGASAAMLIFGLPLGMLALAAGALVATFNGQGDWLAFGLNLVTGGLWPAWVAQRVWRTAEARLPQHFFVYIFVSACFGAALSVMAVGVLATALLATAGGAALEQLLGEYLPYFLLLGFSEAWLTGMTLTLLTINRPDWVASFDDRRYLSNK